MLTVFDEDEYKTVTTSRPCTVCNGDHKKCNGGCNGSFGLSSVRRSAEEIAKIKAEKLRKHEDEILIQADAIRVRRLGA